MANAIFWIITVLSFAMSYSIGANDAANALGTSYGSNAANIWILLCLGAFFELFGAVYCSSKLAAGLAYKLLPTLSCQTDAIQERLMLGTCLSSFSFILASSIFGMPISGTHTVIGALIGAGLAGLAASSLNWKKVGWTVASWFISPVLAAILAGVLFIVIVACTLGGAVQDIKARLFYLTLVSGLSISFADYMVLGLVDHSVTNDAYYSILGAFFLGFFGCRLCIVLKAK